MGYFDMDKNSLPEQVQENKDKIKELETNSATIEYVDEKDADTLQSAKDYADDQDADVLQDAKDYADYQKISKATLLHKGSMIYGNAPYSPYELEIGAEGDVLKVGSLGIPEWAAPEKVKAADIDSESATAGQVLAADGNGGAVWQAQSGGSTGTLIWSGSLSCTPNTSIPFTLTDNKQYRIGIKQDSANTIEFFEYKIISQANVFIEKISNRSSSSCIFRSCILSLSTGKISLTSNIVIDVGSTSTTTGNINILEVYEL